MEGDGKEKRKRMMNEMMNNRRINADEEGAGLIARGKMLLKWRDHNYREMTG